MFFFFSVRLTGERWLSPLYEKQLPRLATDAALHRCDLYNNGSISSPHLHLFIVIIIIIFFTLSWDEGRGNSDFSKVNSHNRDLDAAGSLWTTYRDGGEKEKKEKLDF